MSRSAEKARVSTCRLADCVAFAVIEKFRNISPWNQSSGQSVLAGIVLLHNTDIQVLSMGVGNKFCVPTEDGLGDMHAEVLARRSFKYLLLQQWHHLQNGGQSDWFELTQSHLMKPKGKLVLYVSSAPCGNACIRRWATSKKEVFIEDLLGCEFPEGDHSPFYAHSKHEGQTAVSFKGSSEILSCSDKLLRWNVLGLQGNGLSGIVDKRILLDGVVIGRKFVGKHAKRAFCCRLDTRGVDAELRGKVHHPVLMCSAVKFDESAFEAGAGEGAIFSSWTFWWTCNGKSEIIDGTTGLVEDGSVSILKHIPPVNPPTSDSVKLQVLLSLELVRL